MLIIVMTRGSVRRKSKETFLRVLELRKKGHSYSEIKRETGIAKSTINNWLTYAGMTLSKDHFAIQAKKRLQNYVIATMAARLTRKKNRELEQTKFVDKYKTYLNDPFFVSGTLLYQAEGSKNITNSFSNSDYRLICFYIKYLEKYLNLDRNKDLNFRLYIHESRKSDLKRIISFWSKKMNVHSGKILLSWKHNLVLKRRINLDYVGQMEVRVMGQKHFILKLLSVSDIILKRYT